VDDRKIDLIARSYHRSLPAEARSATCPEDLAQMARLKAWMADSRYDARRASRATFMRRVVENHLRDEFKRASRVAREVKLEIPALDTCAFREAEDSVLHSIEAADRYLRSLSREARAAFDDLASGRLRRAKLRMLAHRDEIIGTAEAMGVSAGDILAALE